MERAASDVLRPSHPDQTCTHKEQAFFRNTMAQPGIRGVSVRFLRRITTGSRGPAAFDRAQESTSVAAATLANRRRMLGQSRTVETTRRRRASSSRLEAAAPTWRRSVRTVSPGILHTSPTSSCGRQKGGLLKPNDAQHPTPNRRRESPPANPRPLAPTLSRRRSACRLRPS